MTTDQQNTYDRYISLLLSQNLQPSVVKDMVIAKMRSEFISELNILNYVGNRFPAGGVSTGVTIEETIVEEEVTFYDEDDMIIDEEYFESDDDIF